MLPTDIKQRYLELTDINRELYEASVLMSKDVVAMYNSIKEIQEQLHNDRDLVAELDSLGDTAPIDISDMAKTLLSFVNMFNTFTKDLLSFMQLHADVKERIPIFITVIGDGGKRMVDPNCSNENRYKILDLLSESLTELKNEFYDSKQHWAGLCERFSEIEKIYNESIK